MITKKQLIDVIFGFLMIAVTAASLNSGVSLSWGSFFDVVFLVFGFWLLIHETKQRTPIVITIDSDKFLDEDEFKELIGK